MMKLLRLLLIGVASYAIALTTLNAQSIIKPRSLHVQFPALDLPFDNDSVFVREQTQFHLGHHWGGADFAKINRALNCNFTNSHWSYVTSDGPGGINMREEVRRLDRRRDNYLSWALGEWEYKSNALDRWRFFQPWIGMRYEPAENAGNDRNWMPRDSAAWPFGFEARHLGYVPTSPLNENYRRFVLDTALISLSEPTVVLDSAHPRVALCNVKDVIRQDAPGRPAEINGQRMILTINLRRLHSTDTVRDDTPVLKLQVRGVRFEYDPEDDDPIMREPAFFNFYTMPDPDGTDVTTLREGRGKRLGTVPAFTFPQEIVIKRRHLPVGADRDITIAAEFHTDSVYLYDAFTGKTISQLASLKSRPYLSHRDLGDQAHLIDTVTPVVTFYDNTSVAIQSVSLVSPYLDSVLCGYKDSIYALAFEDELRKVDSAQKIWHDLSVADTTAGIDSVIHKLRLWNIYAVDEWYTLENLGVWYRAHLLDTLYQSESGTFGQSWRGGIYQEGDALQRYHMMPMKQIWTSGLVIVETPTFNPSIAFGSPEWNVDGQDSTPSGYPFIGLGFERGYRNSYDSPTRLPYAAHNESVGVSDVFKHINPLRSYEWFGLPLESKWVDDFPGAYGAIADPHSATSFQAVHEGSLFRMFYQTGSYYFDKKKTWWGHVFNHWRTDYGRNKDTVRYARIKEYRPLTGTEVRLTLGTMIAFGAKGIAYDRFKDARPDEVFIRDSMPVKDPTKHDTIPFKAWARTVLRGVVENRYPSVDYDSLPAFTPENILFTDSLGGDFIHTAHTSRFDEYHDLDASADAMQLDRLWPGDAEEHIYIGDKSMRVEIARWHSLLMDDRWNRDLFAMRPHAWIGVGYQRLVNGDVAAMTNWVDTAKSAFGMKYWTKNDATDPEYRLVDEPLGQRLYDMVLLDPMDTLSVATDHAILAVTNRRTWAAVIDPAMPDSIRMYTQFEFDSIVRDSSHWRYRQLGARRITVPLRYDSYNNRPVLIHVQEMSIDNEVTLDTIVSGISNLELNFTPGQTRFFHLRRLKATENVTNGYLAFNTQTKIVAYPVRNGTNATDSIRYHMVYHAKDAVTGVWTVYYKRSRAYKRDSLPEVSGLVWDPTVYNVSKLTTLSRPFINNLGAANTLLDGMAGIEYDGPAPIPPATIPSAYPMRDRTQQLALSCGFPSIVVREPTSGAPTIHIVYACQDAWAPADIRTNYFHIVENQFLDNHSLDAGAIESNGASMVVAKKRLPHMADSLNDLAIFGTPAIGLAANHNVYYAWSADKAGPIQQISAGRKWGTDRFFTSAASITTVPSLTIAGKAGGDQRYPTLNPYSNISQGHQHVSLAWQESGQIRYTRLKAGVGGGWPIQRFLPNFIEMSWDAGTPPAIQTNPVNAVAIISDTASTSTSGMPVIARTLQQNTMRVYIRDSAGGIAQTLNYNIESIAWQEYTTVPGVATGSRIRHRHFWETASPEALHYWWTGTTYDTTMSLYHPVMMTGAVRLDSLVWQGIVDDTLRTYDDSLKIITGNVSDSALILNHSRMPKATYDYLRSIMPTNYRDYWQGRGNYFSFGEVVQLLIRNYPATPRPYQEIDDGVILHNNGTWPHISVKRRENYPGAINATRRITQSSSSGVPTLTASAERFYKNGSSGEEDEEIDNQRSETPFQSAVFGGFELRGSTAAARVVLSNGTPLTFEPDYQASIPDGYSGNPAIAHMVASMTTPIRELVSQPLTVDAVQEVQLQMLGGQREGVELSIEEVGDGLTDGDDEDRGQLHANDAMSRSNSGDERRSLLLSMPPPVVGAESARDAVASAAQRQFYLTSGDDKMYRFRLRYTGGDNVVYHELRDLAPADYAASGTRPEFGKGSTAAPQIVNLSTMKAVNVSPSAQLHVYPNPSSTGTFSVIAQGFALEPWEVPVVKLSMQVVDALGVVVTNVEVRAGDVLDVSGLPAGTYHVRIIADNGLAQRTVAAGQAVVVR